MRLPARFLLTGAAVIVVSSCASDQLGAPARSPIVNGSSILRALVVAQTVDFVIPEQGATINLLDAYELKFPSGAVCDPNATDTKAGYEAQAWDAPCTPVSGDVAVRATLKYSNGHLYVDFQPALRFVPSKQVTIGTSVMAAEAQARNDIGQLTGWTINYTPGIDAHGIADALNDASLRTVVVGTTGRIYRRVKHFSGYMVQTGEGWVPCDPNQGNPLCVWVEDEDDLR